MSEHDPEKRPDERPRPKYGELAPPGWVWRPPQDADRLDTTHHSPAASEVEQQPPAPPQPPAGPGQHAQGPHAQGPYAAGPQLRADAPRWNLTFTIVMLVIGFFGMTYSIGTLQALPAAMELLHSSQNLGPYVQDPSVAPLITVGTVVMAGIWAISAGLSVWLLVQKRLAFYIPLVAGVVALVTLFVILGIIFSTDPVLLDFYSGISPTPGPSSSVPTSPTPTTTPTTTPTPGVSASS
ncbi:DUF6264 family protein [Leifsonia sp. Leaf336]|uniref:DUF6264 family protein n=1 Tax=Leifsonia sp. Leaf336 TaxID=1736341 RepID=UPI000A44A462|nr:DUF6264 family protein [Leifsonia sp. Leaf336]